MEEFQSKAGRLLAFAHKELEGYHGEPQEEVEQELVYDGFAVISDPLSPDVYESIRNCQSAGIEVKMLTGDNMVSDVTLLPEFISTETMQTLTQYLTAEESSTLRAL